VGQFEGRDMAKSLSAPFIECSASDGINIDVAFRELVKLIRKDERVRLPLYCRLLKLTEQRRSFAAKQNGTGPPSTTSSVPPMPLRSNSQSRPMGGSPNTGYRNDFDLTPHQRQLQIQQQQQQSQMQMQEKKKEVGCGCVLM